MAKLLVEMYDGNRYNVILDFDTQELNHILLRKANVVIKVDESNFQSIKYRFPIEDFQKLSDLIESFIHAPKVTVSQLNAIYHNS